MTDDHSTAPTTALGTPASPRWDADWLALVNLREQDLGRRICGAHTPAWTPCTLVSSHPNGRCRFHGGAPGIGAPGGNRNAWVHGLYSRRLQQCGDHCPLWQHCPMAGRDVLDLLPAERPHCVYEQDEYDEVLRSIGSSPMPESASSVQSAASATDPRTLSDPAPILPMLPIPPIDPDPLRVSSPPREPGLIERNIALFQVMLTRAQAALRITRLTDEFHAEGHRYNARSVRVSAIVQAQLHIARELRQWLKLLPGLDPHLKTKRAPSNLKPPEPERRMGLPDIMKPILEETEVAFDELLGPGGFPGRARKSGTDFPPAFA